MAWCRTYSISQDIGFVVLCFVVVMQSFIMNSHEVFFHIHQGCFAGTGAIVRLPQCQWSKPDGYGKISQCITTTKHSKAKTVCIFLGIYCTWTNADVLPSGLRGIGILSFSFTKIHLKLSSAKKTVILSKGGWVNRPGISTKVNILYHCNRHSVWYKDMSLFKQNSYGIHLH